MDISGDVPLSRDSSQQLKAMRRRNTVLQDLNLTGTGAIVHVETVSSLTKVRNRSIRIRVRGRGFQILLRIRSVRSPRCFLYPVGVGDRTGANPSQDQHAKKV
jgi:hypothetical protein